MTRRELFMLLASTAVSTSPLVTAQMARAAAPIQATLYKNPQCSCCEGYVRVPVEGDHGFRWKLITQSGGT